jgi:6,7-dimethyl-8-ribityllumazine synthase
VILTMKVALIVSRYHAFVTDGLQQGAREALVAAGLAPEAIVVLPVPGAYELAQAASRAASTGEFAAVVCLGCLIRGETPHFDYIAQAAAHGILRAAQSTGVPMGFGLLTTNTAEEAMVRSAPGDANKGREAATAALEMAALYRRIGVQA